MAPSIFNENGNYTRFYSKVQQNRNITLEQINSNPYTLNGNDVIYCFVLLPDKNQIRNNLWLIHKMPHSQNDFLTK